MIFATAAGTLGTAPWVLTARIIRFDDITGTGTRGADELRRQDLTAFAASSIAGSHVFGLTGEDTNLNRVVDTNVPDTAFRWDPTDQQWIFNITTVNLSAGSTYVYTIMLNDGSAIVFQFGLR